jgi:hypothetical protein
MSVKRSRFAPFRPRVEPLEPRLCLAGSVLQLGDLLVIRGDETDNHLAITDSGGELHVTLDDPVPHLFDGIRRIMIDLGEGSDFCDLQLGGPDTLVKKLTANLGAGNDHASLFIDSMAGQALAISVAGQGDDDVVGFSWGMMEGSLQLTSTGGDGHDLLTFESHGEFTGKLNINTDGGNGDDEVGIIVVDGLEGNMSANANGGAGDDEVGVVVIGGKAGSFNLNVSGGSGDDVLIQELMSMDAKVTLACLGGVGNDSISQSVELAASASGRGRSIKMTSDGGTGNDVVAAEASYLPSEPRAGIPTDSFLVAAKGGAGDDQVAWVFEGPEESPSRLQARIEGGDGDDQLSAVDAFTPNAQLHVLSLLGGNGDDQMGIIVQSDVGPHVAELLWIVDGGAGLDEALVPRGLRTRRCELVLTFGT